MDQEKKIIDRKLTSGFKRLGAFLIDLIFVFFLSVTLDKIFVHQLVGQISNYPQIIEVYENKCDQYKLYEDYYELYIYDEDNNRIKNENVSQSNLDNFMLDENVLSLREEIPNLQNKLLIIDWIAVGVDAFLGSLIYFVFAYIILGRGRSIGLYILKSELVDENGNKLSFKKCILYGFFKWLFVFPLGIITLFILPITMLYKVFYDDNHQTILDKKMKIECRILVKNISD